MSNQPELKVKGLDRKLKQSEIDFMKLIEEQNLQRVLKLKRTRKLNIITGNCTIIESFRHSHFNIFVCPFRRSHWLQRFGDLRILHVCSAAREIPRRFRRACQRRN